MSERNTSEANWVNVDVATLPQAMQVAYAEYKDAQRKAAALREVFEQGVTKLAALPEGKRMVFGYRFGKLSAAIVDDERKPSKAKQATVTLADFIAAQGAAGRAC